MIKNFANFLNEYVGPYGTLGFRYSKPTKEITLNLDMKYSSENEDIIKDILKKYDISTEDISLARPYGTFGALQKLKLKFLTYSELEANSIIISILKELREHNIMFDNESIETTPKMENPFQRKPIKGFGK